MPTPKRTAIPKISIEVGPAIQALLTLQMASFDGDVKERYRVGRLIARLENVEELQAADRTRRQLVDKYGERDPVTGSTQVKDWAGFNGEYGEIAKEKVEVEDLKPLPFEFLDRFYFLRTVKTEDGEKQQRVPLQPNDLKVLMPFFEALPEE